MKNSKIGLALSGGGYRAAAFHLGVFKKLKEMKILDNLNVLSTISGGSIIGTYYLLKKDDFKDFYESFRICLKTSTIKKILLMPRALLTMASILVVIVALFYFLGDIILSFFISIFFLLLVVIFLFKIISFSDLVERAYKDIFFSDKKLIDLPDLPKAAINTTNLVSGLPFTFSKYRMGDSFYSYGKYLGKPINFKTNNFPLSVAVSASTAVPFPFNPIKIHKEHFENETYFDPKINPLLVDGGVYDNQGIHKITFEKSSYRCEYLIMSDGSAPFEKTGTPINSFPVLMRVNNIMMRRIRNLQIMLNVFYSSNSFIKEITYFALDWNCENSINDFIDHLRDKQIRKSILEYHNIPSDITIADNEYPEHIINLLKNNINYDEIVKNKLSVIEIEKIKDVKTSLSALSDEDIDLLERHASILTELQIKLYCPTLLDNN